MKTKLTLALITLTGLIAVASYVSGGISTAAPVVDDKVNPHYKRGSSFNLAGAGPNVARCGAFPENVELSFTGGGIDTEGGYNTAVFAANAHGVPFRVAGGTGAYAGATGTGRSHNEQPYTVQ